jgi:LysM repeat protein
MKAVVILPLLGLAGALAGGCTTLATERQMQAARSQTQLDTLQMEVRRLQARVDGMAQAQQDIYQDMDRLRSELAGSDQALDGRLDAVEQRLVQAEAAREQMKREIVDGITKQMSEMLRSARPAAPAASTRVEEGYEHVVQTGETLSEIAAAYGVSVAVIVRTNNLKNPDSIRVGQKLFIPE